MLLNYDTFVKTNNGSIKLLTLIADYSQLIIFSNKILLERILFLFQCPIYGIMLYLAQQFYNSRKCKSSVFDTFFNMHIPKGFSVLCFPVCILAQKSRHYILTSIVSAVSLSITVICRLSQVRWFLHLH
jgi:hypothetical protein